MSSIIVKLVRENDDGLLVNVNGRSLTLRRYPFSTDTISLSAVTNENGCYAGSLTASDLYKLFVDGEEEVSYGGVSGTFLSCETNNNWTYDRISQIYTTTNVLIGLTGSNSNKLAVYGDTSLTGNLYVTGSINSPALSSLTAGITLNQYTLTSSFASATASLTGATLLSKTSSQIFLSNSSDSLRLGNDVSNTGMKLDVQGQANLGNTTYFGTSAEKGRITWGGSPQSTSFYALGTNDVTLGTIQSGEIIRGTSAGNVGIGTSSPQQKLDVNGAVNFRSALFFGTSGEKGTLTHTSDNFIVRANTGYNLQLGTNFINVVTVASSLNVGINTTTPSSKFSVSGNTSITGTLDVVGTTNKIQFDSNTNATGDIPAGASFWNYGGNFTLLGNPQGTAGHKIVIASFASGLGWRSMLETANSNTVEPTLILAKRGGFIGMGTDTPTQKLSVSGNTSITGNLISSTANNIGLFVLSTGKVGINQSNPAQAFEVSGSLIGGQSFSLGKAPNNSLGYAFNRDFMTGAIYDSTRYAFQFTRPSNADRLDTEVYNGSGTLITARAFTIDSQGFVGIGTNSPATRLQVVGHQSISGGLIRTQLPDNSVTSNLITGQSVTYNKGAFHIVAYNDAGTIKYRYMVLTGTDANWTYSTTAP